jgi:hypothetical protein
MRPGPYRIEEEGDMGYGAPFRRRDNGKVNIGQFYPPWWERQEWLIWQAGLRGIRVEIGMTDLWRARRALDGSIPHPWLPEYNVQGVDRLHGLGSHGHFNDYAMRWFRQVVKAFGRFGNVIWFDGTEASIMPGWSSESTWALRQIVRDLEDEFGYPRHMFGSNATPEAQSGPVDYATVHGRFPLTPVAGKPTNWQEYNGGNTPPTPDQWMLPACEARKRQTHLAMWRGWRPMSAAGGLQVLGRWDTDDCSFAEGRPLPAEDAPGWGRPYAGAFTKQRAFQKALARIWNPCGKSPVMSLEMLAFEMREDGEYAGRDRDAVMVWAGDAFEEIHWVSFGDGCAVGNPYKATWPFSGVLPR